MRTLKLLAIILHLIQAALLHICSSFLMVLVGLLPTLTMLVGLGRIFESICLSVCLFVCSITQKRMIPKCSNLVYGMILGYPTSGTVLGFKGQRSMTLSSQN